MEAHELVGHSLAQTLRMPSLKINLSMQDAVVFALGGVTVVANIYQNFPVAYSALGSLHIFAMYHNFNNRAEAFSRTSRYYSAQVLNIAAGATTFLCAANSGYVTAFLSQVFGIPVLESYVMLGQTILTSAALAINELLANGREEAELEVVMPENHDVELEVVMPKNHDVELNNPGTVSTITENAAQPAAVATTAENETPVTSEEKRDTKEVTGVNNEGDRDPALVTEVKTKAKEGEAEPVKLVYIVDSKEEEKLADKEKGKKKKGNKGRESDSDDEVIKSSSSESEVEKTDSEDGKKAPVKKTAPLKKAASPFPPAKITIAPSAQSAFNAHGRGRQSARLQERQKKEAIENLRNTPDYKKDFDSLGM